MLPNAELRTLPNGMRVVLANDDNAESVTFGVFVASGSRHEVPSVAGISHLIEHMLFKGTRKRTALEISQTVESHGGNFNAYTSEEMTCFYARLPHEFLAKAVDVIADMFFNAKIPATEFDRERRVVIEEIKMYNDEPDAVAAENLSRCLFPHNAVGEPISGSPETLMTFKPADLHNYIKKAYVPRATIAVLVGRFDVEKAYALIGNYFNSFSGGAPLTYQKVNPRSKVIAKKTVMRDIHQAQLALGYRTFGTNDARRYAALVFDCMMGRSMASRLFQAVREKRGLSYDIRSNNQFFDECGGWVVTAGCDAAKVGETLSVIDRELERICDKAPTQKELRRVKDFMLGNYRLSMEKMQTRFFGYGGSVLTYNRIVPTDEIVRKVEAVTPVQVQEVAQAILNPSRRALSLVLPK